MVEHIINRESIVQDANAEGGVGQHLIADAVRRIAIGGGVGAIRSYRRLLGELASIDGAVIFDDDHILAVGAVIEGSPLVGSHIGARTTAALSALHWGGIPAKISSDGDVTIYFDSIGFDGTCPAQMLFT